MKDFFAGTFGAVITAGYVIGPFFGLYAAVDNGSFLNGVLSMIIPFYGAIYFFLA